METEWLKTFNNMYCFFMLVAYPLSVRNGYMDIATSKLVFFYSITALFILAHIIMRVYCKITKTQTRTIEIPKSEIAIIFFLAMSILISFLKNGYYSNKIICFAESHMSITFLWSCILAYYFLRKTPVNKNLFAACAIIGSAAVSVFAVIQFFGYDPGNFIAISEMSSLMSTMSNKDLIGFYFTAMLPFGVYLATQKKWIIVGASCTALTELGILVCDTDAAIACFGAELVLLVLFCAHDEGFKIGYPVCLICMGLGHIILGYMNMKTDSTLEVSYVCTLMLHPYVGMALIGLGVMFLILFRFVHPTIMKALAAFAFLFILAYPLYIYYYTNYRNEMVEDMALPYDSFLYFREAWGSGRGFLWMISVGIFKESDLLTKLVGCGAHGFAPNYVAYCVNHEEFFSRIDFPYYDAHNMYLHFLIEYGILGVTAALIFVIYRVISMLRVNEDDCFYKVKGVVFLTAMISAVFLFCSNVSMAFLPLLL